MWKFLLKNWQYVLIGALVLALYIASKNAIANKQRYKREKSNVETLMSDIEHARTKAGEDVATIGELQLTVEEFKKLRAEDAKLIKETNMTFMKSAKTEQEDLIDQIFNRLLSDRKLAQEIADFTQTSSLIEGVTDNSQNKIQSDIQSYEEKNEVIDVTTGNEQLIWTFQKKVAEQQLLWLNKKISLEDALKYADDHREQSFE